MTDNLLRTMAIITEKTAAENISGMWATVITGMVVVFLILGLLIGLLYIISFFCNLGNKKKKDAKPDQTVAQPAPAPAPVELIDEDENDDEVIAVISAAIAAYTAGDGKTKQAVEILKTLSDDNDATVRASAYDNMWVFEKQDFDEILRKAVSCESDGIARSYAIFSLYDLYLQNDCDTAELIDFMHNLYKTEKDRRCKLQYLRNFYISGETDKLGEIIGYLEDKDYRMRITVVNTISEILNKENKEVLLSVVKKRLKPEKSRAVKASLEKFVSDAEYM